MTSQKSENEIIVKSIVYGSIAFYLGKKAEETNSHKWCVYVRGLNSEDISYFVKEVVFTLHSSFENHNRSVTTYPFELYESGWGQFDIIITIYLIDETAKPIEFVHPLKLYPTQTHASMSTKKPVVSESYEEIIFVNPKPHIREILLNPPFRPQSSIQIPIQSEDERNDSEFSQEEKMIVENNRLRNLNPEPFLRREPSLRIGNTFNENFNNMNICTQMDITPSHIISPSFQQKIENLNIDPTIGNYKIDNEFDQMQVNQDMQMEKALSATESNQAKDMVGKILLN